MSVSAKIVRIGNSKGIRLPAPLIRRYNLGESVRLVETPAGVLLQSENAAQLSLNESFREMAGDSAAMQDARDLADSSTSEGLPGDDFSTWR